MSRSPVRATVALGSNLEDRRAHLEGALAELAAAPGVRLVRRSEWIETAPSGGPPGQGLFLNGAAELEVDLGPRELLALLQRIERAHGRRRDVEHGPRTLDLDLLFYGEDAIAEPDLVVPHPRLEEREFVLRPLAQIDPDRRLRRSGLTVRERLAALDRG